MRRLKRKRVLRGEKMSKRLLGALGLSLVMSSQCLYAEAIEPEYTTYVENIIGIDDDAEFEIIEDPVLGIVETENNWMQENIDSNDVNSNEIDINTEVVETKEEVIEQNPEITEENLDLKNKVILTLNSTIAMVDGVEQTLLTPPTVVNDTTLLPMRFVADQVVGAQVEWNQVEKKVTMSKNGTIVTVTIGSKLATIDGLEVELQTEPIIENGTTLVPVRFLSEAFNVIVDYNAEDKVITLDKSNQLNEEIIEIPNEIPVASFYFPEEFIAGQTVYTVNESYDPDNDEIVDQLWAFVGTEKTITNKELSNMFKTPSAGTYTIGLKVQDSKGAWSDWTYQTVTILPNQAPVITSLMPAKSSFAQGEPISFLPYTYENESWESVKEGKWTYRKLGEAANRATLGKPEALFTEGSYIVTLYIDDAQGNRSVGFETTVNISGDVYLSEFAYKFSNGMIGQWIDNFSNINYLNYKQADILQKSYVDGTLIMSDSPEEVQGRGILYRDSMNGSGRLLIHHINQSSSLDKERLALIVENPTEMPVTVQLINKSIKGPATDILRVGQLSLQEYLSGKVPTETIVLQPGERKFLYDKNWSFNSCISAHIDVETDGEVKFIVANLGSSDTLETIDSLEYFPPDGVHYSGTYNQVGIHYTLNLAGNEPERLSIGLKDAGEWIVGYDERTQAPVENTGNFGVSHYITVTAQEDMGVILNNRGGTFQGAVKWNDQVHLMPGNGTFTGTTTKAVVLGTIKKGETVTIEYLLPNGSAAPTLIGFIPKSYW